MWTYVSSDVLYHHGIKGQRWGVRRFQNEDGTRTAAGKRRYYADIDGAKERVALAKGAVKGTKGAARQNAKQRLQWEKEKLKSEKIKGRLNSEKSKSTHRLKLEEKYRSKGMSEEEAAVAAYKRARTEKIIAGTAALGVTAAASYVAYRHYDRSVDKFIKSDTIMKRVASTDSKSVHDAFYATMGERDAKKYVGLYGNEKGGRDGAAVFQKTIRVKEGLKVASEKNARKALEELVRTDPSFAKGLQRDLGEMNAQAIFGGGSPKQRAAIEKAYDSFVGKGKVNADVYKAFNFGMVGRSETAQRFYDHLRTKGYDAIEDINDRRLSGYNAKTPTIVINASKVAVNDVRKLGKEEIGKNYTKEMLKYSGREVSKKALPYAGVGVGIKAIGKASQSKKRDAIVAQYKKEHPNTTLSYNEILDSYYNK